MNFVHRKGRLQLNSCNKRLLLSGEHTTAEICLWHDDECKTTRHTIARYIRDNDGYDLMFFGENPFREEINVDDFMYLAKLGQQLLTEYFNESEYKCNFV